MLVTLFSSKARVDVMRLFFENPAEGFYQKQIADRIGQPVMAVQRELRKLLSLELIEKSMSGKRAYYQVKKESPIYEELKRIIFKYSGIAEAVRQALAGKKHIAAAFIYGSYATGKEIPSSDIDLFVIGDITSRELSTLLAKPKQALAREINFTVMPAAEFRKKVQARDHFLSRLLSEKKLFLIGSSHELTEIA
jgi:predicted nucleotidyltransferase